MAVPSSVILSGAWAPIDQLDMITVDRFLFYFTTSHHGDYALGHQERFFILNKANSLVHRSSDVSLDRLQLISFHLLVWLQHVHDQASLGSNQTAFHS